MTNDNQDALRCAHELVADCEMDWLLEIGLDQAAAHLRRLVAQNEAKDALLRQAVAVMGLIGADLVCGAAHHEKKDRHGDGEPCPIEKRWHDAFQAIRQHLDQKTT